MPKTNMPPAPDAKEGLLLNRLLFERKGDEFIDAFAALVRTEGWIIGDESLLHLLQVARSVRASANLPFPQTHPLDDVAEDR
ncbi:hypothetical protein [Mesorhizobium sp. CN2-181]|uniref:hypothetical protein n=1 Tax=Mesorhizobium yinganensis TaxID=3157707 RepID=UPI0032B76E86